MCEGGLGHSMQSLSQLHTCERALQCLSERKCVEYLLLVVLYADLGLELGKLRVEWLAEL